MHFSREDVDDGSGKLKKEKILFSGLDWIGTLKNQRNAYLIEDFLVVWNLFINWGYKQIKSVYTSNRFTNSLKALRLNWNLQK